MLGFMNFSSHHRFSLGQPSEAGFQAAPAVATPSEGFMQCPAALLSGLSEEQLQQTASIYQRAFEKAQEELAEREESFPLIRSRFAGDRGRIGWN
jgi:hypothetical protein